jgi:hypothetical protein
MLLTMRERERHGASTAGMGRLEHLIDFAERMFFNKRRDLDVPFNTSSKASG